MEIRYIKSEINSYVNIIRLTRTDVLNSFNRQMGEELYQILESASSNPDIRSILLTGSANAFSAGQDLNEVIDKDGLPVNPVDIILRIYNPLVKLIRSIEKPIVCSVNGVAAGAGANIALACDIVVASSEAVFIQAFSKIGLIPDTGGTFFLPRLIGLQRASALMMLGEKINAQEALQMGLVYKIFPPGQLFEAALTLAKTLAEMPTKSIGYIKKALNASLSNDLDSQLKLEAMFQEESGNTLDYIEGIKAFFEKRKPKFIGK